MPLELADQPLFPVVSFEHTLKEISVNRDDPCELVRELVSNAYDAGASAIRIFPLHQYRGLVCFDNGVGLSEVDDPKAGVSPYVAFFSIGKGTKTPGAGIGYKCQGSKLCFAAGKFSLITRCEEESGWRHITVDNPKTKLNINYNVRPQRTDAPWQLLGDFILPNPDQRSLEVLSALDRPFFETQFKRGTLLIIDSFQTDDFDTRFSTERGEGGHLWNYVRHYSAHANVRRISSAQGFQQREVNAFKNPKGRDCDLSLWVPDSDGKYGLKPVPQGWPYLSVTPGGTAHRSPEDVPRLRDGTFQARFADSFKFGGHTYYLVLAIDGKRHALREYASLDRQGKRISGIKFSDQRGVILCSQGVRVCPYDQIFESPILSQWQELIQGRDHFVLIIDGYFELVTNRNAPAPEATARLTDNKFLDEIKQFLDRSAKLALGGPVLSGLLRRLQDVAVEADENKRITQNLRLKETLPGRDHFQVTVNGCETLSSRWIVAPGIGEEHFVGALYTLFSHVVPDDHPLAEHWSRPLTFSAMGIDALGTTDEKAYAKADSLICIEYKYGFSAKDGFNHPFSITDVIVCWDLDLPGNGESVSDDLHYIGTVDGQIRHGDKVIGVWLKDIRRRDGGGELAGRSIKVLSLRELLQGSFTVKWRKQTASVAANRTKMKKKT